MAFHATAICWGIVFPFHFRRMKTDNKLKYYHITTVILALFLPTLPALINLRYGYIMADTPTTVCVGQSVAVTFFALILPLSVLTAVATSALIIMFLKILKVQNNIDHEVPMLYDSCMVLHNYSRSLC